VHYVHTNKVLLSKFVLGNQKIEKIVDSDDTKYCSIDNVP
jgi:hypothetical protein